MPRHDDRYGNTTRLYVGHLSSRTRSRDLEDVFRRYGRMDTSNGNTQSLERQSTTSTPSIPAKTYLLSQLENILESDPLIDEVGFIHPSQFAALNGEVPSVPSLSSRGHPQPADGIAIFRASEFASDMFFWNREHKLGISTLVILPLYTAAKDAFMEAHKQFSMLSYLDGQKDQSETASSHDIVESQVMKHSRALLLLSSDFGMAWNSRKLVLSKQQQFQMFMDEILLSSLVLSYSPKSESAWSHRRWVIKMIAGKCPNLLEIVERESELVKMLAENSKMNYRAWNHRCWLVSYMPEAQVLHELQKSRDWAGLHVADNSCFHYRARLLLRIVEDLQHQDLNGLSSAELQQLLKEELDWVGLLIMRYVGREALWLHRRFLSLLWMKYFATCDRNISGPSCCESTDICDNSKFVDNELKLYETCTIIPDNDFEDYQAQAIYSATYIIWLAKRMPESFGVELQKKAEDGKPKRLLEKLCPGKSFLWDSSTGHF